MMLNVMTADDRQQLLHDAAALLEQAGMGDLQRLQRIEGGRNNRVYRVESDRGPALLKAYFHHPRDPRDRLGAEWSFSILAAHTQVRRTPLPLARDPHRRVAIYSWVESNGCTPASVTEPRVLEAARFVSELNQLREHDTARAIKAGSEACFSIESHLQLIAGRIDRLRAISAVTDAHRRAAAFVEHYLRPCWREVRGKVRHGMQQADLQPHDALPIARRCISPSDFGFHNAMIDREGLLWFHDFEYAGWDDPAKLVGDFFHQPRCPVPRSMFPRFIEVLADGLDLREQDIERTRLLLPAYALKWCAILLNEFMPVDADRRSFAADDEDEAAWRDRWQTQLQLAEQCLADRYWIEGI